MRPTIAILPFFVSMTLASPATSGTSRRGLPAPDPVRLSLGQAIAASEINSTTTANKRGDDAVGAAPPRLIGLPVVAVDQLNATTSTGGVIARALGKTRSITSWY
ncbi:hypothetical protein B0H63DRAFT_447378 [Podospora didyma]|uniref:Uncharacterized protein n=1 Tax=Podospora didyma TaxID=330526 RepID=A0AAE0U0U3_9PEZI|nr:hypothetical protein B0H63DRAFT_447378 [Podospora didyma]